MHKIKHSKPYIDQEDIKAVSDVIASGNHSSGKKTREFKNKVRKLIGTNYAKATTSGTTALHLALLSLDIHKGDEVILPSYVCQAVLNAVNYTHARPVLADIDPDFNKGYNISANTIKSLINPKTKAIIVPHMFGTPANINEINDLGIPVIEDCAQSLGIYDKENNITGNKGLLSIFSFYATKMISTGNGGMVTTSNTTLKQKLEDLTKYDKRKSYQIAYNYNMSDIQSALGMSQLKKLPTFIQTRKEIAERYNEAFKNLGLILPNLEQGVPFRYVIGLKDKDQRDVLENKLKEKNIEVNKPIFKPLHQYLKFNKKNFINSEKAYNTTLSIPIYPALKDEEVNYIIENITNLLT